MRRKVSYITLIYVEQEKAFVRQKSLEIVLSDPSDRVAVQGGLLIANIARFDYPDSWATLIQDLVYKSSVSSDLLVENRCRPLKTLKYVVKALQTKRFILEEPGGGPLLALSTDSTNLNDIAFHSIEYIVYSLTHLYFSLSFIILLAELQGLSQKIEEKRRAMKNNLETLIKSTQEIWEHHFAIFSSGNPQWRVHVKICISAMAVCREALIMLDSIDQAGDDFKICVGRTYDLALEAAGFLFQSNITYGREEERESVSKCWEHALQIGLVAMDRHTKLFAPFLPKWLSLCVDAAILAVNKDIIHSIRPKSRVLATRFVARALLQPHFVRETPMWKTLLSTFNSQQGSLVQTEDMNAAIESIDNLLSSDQNKCFALVEAVVSKYIVIGPDEKEEWELDPEDFARELDAETSPDADSPRPCGVALLQCMLERSESHVQKAIVDLANQVAQNTSTMDETILAREAVYRTIGECFRYMHSVISFDTWYSSELRNLVVQNTIPGMSKFASSILQTRTLWLLGICGDYLSANNWSEALVLCGQHLMNEDVTSALMAVSALTALISDILEEQQFMSHSDDNKILMLEGPVGTMAGDDILHETKREYQIHFDTVINNMDMLLMNCFNLLPRLSEVESMIRVLHCMTAIVELVGEKVQSHFHSFSNSLPSLWSMLTGTSKASGGSMVRFQCSLLAMLGHLVSKLGRVAVEDPQISQVIMPLLISSTDPNNPLAEPLADDALRLWLAILHASPSLTQGLADLGPSRLVPHLERAKDLEHALQIAAAYAIHGGLESIEPMLPLLASRCSHVIHSVVDYLTQPSPPETGKDRLISNGVISPQITRDLDSALNLLTILQRLYTAPPQELAEPIKACSKLLSIDLRKSSRVRAASSSFLPKKMVNMMQPALQIVCRLIFASPSSLNELTEGDEFAQIRLLDRWAILGSSNDVGEVFVSTLAILGRSRRHNASVSMCSLILSDCCPALRDGPRLARMFIIILKAAKEQSAFERDQEKMWKEKTEYVDHVGSRDYLQEKKLCMTRQDPLYGVDTKDAARMAANHVCGWMGKDTLLKLLGEYDPIYKVAMEKLLSSQLPEQETEQAIQSMQHAHL